MINSLAAKAAVAPDDQEATLRRLQKHLGLVVDTVKLYKVWLKKGQDAEWITGMESLRAFAMETPEVVLDLPPCMIKDDLEMMF
eukprot:6194985-Lingulodinium_polyedra.AAC.1